MVFSLRIAVRLTHSSIKLCWVGWVIGQGYIRVRPALASNKVVYASAFKV